VFKLSERKSILQKGLSHPIINNDLKVALIGFYTTYLTPNISNKNNKLPYEENGTTKEMVIPPGQYDITTLEKYINSQPPFDSQNISIKGNDITNRVDIKSPFKLFFGGSSDIGKVLGFNTVLVPNQDHTGSNVPKFHPFETIDIHCNLANGMSLKLDDYKHRKSDIIASFRTNAEYKELIIYEPVYPLFFPLQHLEFDHIEVVVRDESGDVIDFGKSLVTVILKVFEVEFFLL
jgi:hypothetical protein